MARVDPQAIALCKISEGRGDGDRRTPLLEPYICPAGVPTIGYGTTRYPDGRAVTMQDPAITEERAVELLLWELGRCADAVDRLIKVQLTPWQRAALIDFTYNLGAGNLKASTLRARINRGDPTAWEELARWVRGGGRILPGLVLRRAREKQLWLTGSWDGMPPIVPEDPAPAAPAAPAAAEAPAAGGSALAALLTGLRGLAARLRQSS